MMTRRWRCVLLIAMLIAAAPHATAQIAAEIATEWFGTWTLNLAKSTYVPGPPPYVRASYVIARSKDGVTVTYDMVYPRGGTTHWEWTGKFDGQPYVLQGVDDYVTYTYRRVD